MYAMRSLTVQEENVSTHTHTHTQLRIGERENTNAKVNLGKYCMDILYTILPNLL